MPAKICTADEATRLIHDGNTVAFHFWGFVGAPGYLIKSLAARELKDLTLYVNNFVALPAVLTDFGFPDLTTLLPGVKKIITPFIGSRAFSNISGDFLGSYVKKGLLEIEPTSHGTYVERLHAGAMGLGGFYSPVGLDTIVARGKEVRRIDGRDYLFEGPMCPDIGLVRADRADQAGNLVYRGSAQGANPLVAMASKITIAEVFEIVEPGELDPEAIGTPGIFVDHIVKIPDDDPCGNRDRQEKIKYLIELILSGATAAVTPPEAEK